MTVWLQEKYTRKKYIVDLGNWCEIRDRYYLS